MHAETSQVNSLPEEISRQSVEINKFEAIPEHGGGLQNLIERYGECPFIMAMGAAGIELVQKLATAESNPDRGPTMRELWEAKKKQAQTSVSTSRAPIEATTTMAKTVESKVKLPASVTAPEVAALNPLDYENTVVIIEPPKPPKPPTKRVVAVTTKPSAPLEITAPVRQVSGRRQAVRAQVELTIESGCPMVIQPDRPPLASAAENFERQSVANISTVQPGERSEFPKNQAPEIIQQILETEPGLIAEAVFPVDDAVIALPKEPVELIDQIGLKPATRIDDFAEFNESLAQPVVEGLWAEVIDNPETDSQAAEIVLAPEFDAKAEVDLIEIAATPVREILMDTIEQPSDESVIDPSAPASVTYFELQAELSSSIQLLEPYAAEIAQTILNEIAVAVHTRQERPTVDQTEVIIQAEEIEQLFVQLFESIGLNYSEELVKNIVQFMFVPERPGDSATKNPLQVVQPKDLGTREYKSAKAMSMLTDWGRSISQKIQPHILLGRYAVQVSAN